MNIIHQIALDSEKVCYCEDGIWLYSNPFFGILFKDVYDEFVYNKALCLMGVF